MNRSGPGKGEIEHEQEVPPADHGDLLYPLALARSLQQLQVDHLEPVDRLLLSPLEDLEMIGGESSQRLAVRGDLDMDTDRVNLDPLRGDRFFGGGCEE